MIQSLASLFQRWVALRLHPLSDDPPLRAELMSGDQLVRHARMLAEKHEVIIRHRDNRLLACLDANEQVLRDFNRTTLIIGRERHLTPAAEWLLDNFYLIEEQIQLARRHLPSGYSRELPRLVRGSSSGLPRVYDIILELIAHVDAQIDAEPLSAFVAAYQSVSSLKLGELWAIPIMLRLGLIENLRRIATRLTLARADRDSADVWVNRLQEMTGKQASQLVIVVAEMAKADLSLSSAFVAEFCQRLSRQSPILQLARNWLDQRLAEQGTTIELLIHQESQSQAADQVSVSHGISSLRFLSTMDWMRFVESHSQVETILRSDPASVYAEMDFQTRDCYRHAVESLARHGRVTESEAAEKAIRRAAEGVSTFGMDARPAHVGYHLIGRGHDALRADLGVRLPWSCKVEAVVLGHPLLFYGGTICLSTILAGLAWSQKAQRMGISEWLYLSFVPIVLIGASQLAVALTNLLFGGLIKPRLLPRLDYSRGLPPDRRTMVVVPTLISTEDGVDQLIGNLEIHHLANPDTHLHFALLTDFTDSLTESTLGDAALLERARLGIIALNQRYSAAGRSIFYLFHRPRRWNAGERLWMGYERKRGKLSEFNAFLRGGASHCFSVVIGEIGILASVRYVVTLDSDTQLPRNAARQLVGIMAHRLNRPEFDPARGIVTDGYGILQPRVGVSLPTARRTWFARLFAGDSGIDPYTRAVSDLYQDLFQEGSFVGKGIYDVDTFERVMAGRFPENTVLSHDLLEACHARSALVSDVEFYEGFPTRYNVDAARRHRWIRGDWQAVRWLLRCPPRADGATQANPLTLLSQWKLLDNLRRSLVPAALTAFLLGSWLFIPSFALDADLLVVGVLILPAMLMAFGTVMIKPEEIAVGLHLCQVGLSAIRQLGQLLLNVAFLPCDAALNLDAIARTVARVCITGRRLMQWRTSGESESHEADGLIRSYCSMASAPLVATVSGIAIAYVQPGSLPVALPFLLLWWLGPGLAWWISRTISTIPPALTADQLQFLRLTARRTWRFFEAFVTVEENWLPPDNFQEIPAGRVASRTSPTNMGLALLSNLTACDFGYLSPGLFLRRSRDALTAMQRLERHRGHFFNWYNTRTQQPLLPQYISSVDSGNLAVHLLTLSAGLRELAGLPMDLQSPSRGLMDTVRIIRLAGGPPAALDVLEAVLTAPTVGLGATYRCLSQVALLTNALLEASKDTENQCREWANVLDQNCRDHLADLLFIAPWLTETDTPTMASTDSVSGHWETVVNSFDSPLSLTSWACLASGLAESVESSHRPPDTATPLVPPARKLSELIVWLQQSATRTKERLAELEELARVCETMAAMDFTFLFDSERKLFSTGFRMAEHRCDPGYYDLLASEARVCSFVAIALGQIPQDHWFALGRLLVGGQCGPKLVSWSGSMFEYLMPMLVMPSYENTLLDRTCRAAVRQQIAYGKLRGVPWGISESGYNRTDVELNYQYRAFGVPGLGLKRGLSEDLVIAPYATALALMIDPRAACENLQRLYRDGRSGNYGFYEAIDYTPTRLPPGESSATVRSFMVHHQGMSLLALSQFLQEGPMQRRFLACPVLKASDLLLQERVPRAVPGVFAEDLTLETTHTLAAKNESMMRVFTEMSPQAPEVQLLSNGRYHVMVSSTGGGYARWKDLSVSRWQEDATRDCWGTFVYLREPVSGEFWSATPQPTLCTTLESETIFTEARAEFRHRNSEFEVHLAISVSPEDDVELRRLTITNHSALLRELEVTTYLEPVLALAAADIAHPLFSKMFLQTEFNPGTSALLCTRRARSKEEMPPWLIHLLIVPGGDSRAITCETDRARFIGRCGSLVQPDAMATAIPLSNTVGAVPDSILSLRRTLRLTPYQTATMDIVTGMAETREAALSLVERYQSPRMSDRGFDLAWTHGQVTLRHLDATEGDAQLFSRLASALIYADPVRRANACILRGNRKGQNALWSYGISGDLPILLLRISDANKIEIVRQLIKAHAYWRMKGLITDLVILNEDISVYRQSLHDQIISLVSSGLGAQLLDKPGGIFVRHLEQMSHEDRTLLQAVARVFVDDERGTLADQVEPHLALVPLVPAFSPVRIGGVETSHPLVLPKRRFPNGLGGFSEDGQEYIVFLESGQTTPAPWVNVIANPTFGTIVSESGSGYTWLENSHEFRLTPWSNDPVMDTPGEALYLRDEETGQFWSPTPLPVRGATPYLIRHGFGYSIFEHSENGIHSELTIFVAMDAPVKFYQLKLRNDSGRTRRVSITGYWEWVLGELRTKTFLHVQTEVDFKTGALLAYNHYNSEFPNRIAFVDVSHPHRTSTGDRREFIGGNGNLGNPAALRRSALSGRVGAGLDPCGAVQVALELADAQERETTFRLGVGCGLPDVSTLIQRYRRFDSTSGVLASVRAHWQRILGTIQIETPDPAANFLANGWLLYQTLSCRLWGRTGFYQSGGAYGFRDQLQDVMALVHAAPTLTREHILRAAAHQFREGDVQHWWHPPSGRGVRTHFSDDLLWLPYVTCQYVETVGDHSVLDEKIGLLEARLVKPEEESYYDQPNPAEESITLYQHGVRAIERGSRFGTHGLPLMGCGDWNDGMNRVGNEGRGESVWLAFFLYDVLIKFERLARHRLDTLFADRCLATASNLQKSIEAQGWDGDWYRRAYFDNGEPLGSHLNTECQIDSIPQSWAVISGAADPVRARHAMSQVDGRLVRRGDRLIQLFDPPFDKSTSNPGYIKGYIPGVRENGGQYTHAAIWSVMAFALLDQNSLAWELFGLINPVLHSLTPKSAAIYKVEPYVVAADVYSRTPYIGRGGWTWYTGSAGWMYRLLVETLLGLNRVGDQLFLSPHLPDDWNQCTLHYRFHESTYHIHISLPNHPSAQAGVLTVDGEVLPGVMLPLKNDHRDHLVTLLLARPTPPPPLV